VDVDEGTERALASGQFVDMTTIGRRTGLERRIEIAIHHFGDRWYISGQPSRRKRAWLANLETDPALSIHLKRPDLRADLPARARVIDDPDERREVLEKVAAAWRRTDVDGMVEFSPLIEVTFLDRAA
jgi:hypothetical protein